MKTCVKYTFLLPTLIAVLNLIPASPATAQAFTVLHTFTGNDGISPFAGLVLSGNTLYGTTAGGSTNGNGTVFAIQTNGTGFNLLHIFSAGPGTYPYVTNNDGAMPLSLILSGNTLYGTAAGGGSWSNGTVFAVNTDGPGFAVLHTFTAATGSISSNSDGFYPLAGLKLSGKTLYGAAGLGGIYGNGTVFALNTDGTGFTVLHTFNPGMDGYGPQARLILSGKTLYGTTSAGSSLGNGTIFAVNTDGTGFTVLHAFTASPGSNATNNDGASPQGALTLSGKTLYGTATGGGNSGNGTVFALNTGGTGFTVLHTFTASSGTNAVNSDGMSPESKLVLSGNTLYGTAPHGGTAGNGTVFAVNTDGTGFTVLHTFTATPVSNATNSDGTVPQAGLILSGNTLYGAAASGGSSGCGTVFSLVLPAHP
jgi:uncharacterized repeat protein (TIGR03803 family)